MPAKSLSPCTYPGCSVLVKGGRCSKHFTKGFQGAKEYDRRRGTSTERGYDWRWRRAREAHLAQSPLCVECAEAGRIVGAEVVDHIIPHKGDMALFWDTDNWQSLCKLHHDRKTYMETHGAHVLPRWVRKPACPVWVVCGPPGAGKSHGIGERWPNAKRIDMASIKAKISGEPLYADANQYIWSAIAERNKQLDSLADGGVKVAVLETLAPQMVVRRHWRELLNAQTVVVETEPGRCLDNIKAQEARRAQPMEFWRRLVMWWWEHYATDTNDEKWGERVEGGTKKK